MPLKIGDAAPDFSLPCDQGGTVSLSDFKGKKLVVYFYPKDDTPGCTKEAIGFSCLADQFAAAQTVVIGVSKDSVKSHAKFRDKHALTIHLASDEPGTMIDAYGAWVEKSMYGRSYMGIDRATVLIDRNGKVAQLWSKVKVPGHAEAVLAAAQGLA
jgi:thioredoxin-dependent peroxiredoxin